MRRAVVLAVALVMGGCAGTESARDEGPASRGEPTPGQEVFPIVASSEIVVGENRLQIGLIDRNDAPIKSPKTALQASFLGPGDEQPSSHSTMSFLWTIKPFQGLWVGEATFDEPGRWEAVIEVEGYGGSVRAVFDVRQEGTTPEIGERPPAVDTPTNSDVADLSEISTDSHPDPRFYRLSIEDALEDERPAVIVFATPKFCESQVCGPTLSIVRDVSKDFPDVNFVHVEPYDLDRVPEELEPVPAVTAWGLPSEPWVFVTDSNGRVVAKYETSVPPKELRALLMTL